MEFHEKLQTLRKNRSMTQEELAQALYVSRTAISKWESGKGYPSIDSLKAISQFFDVSIDELLSTQELMEAAQDENASNLRRICDQLFGLADLMSLTLILLPLYPEQTPDYVAAVSLFACTQEALAVRCAYWVLFAAMVCLGLANIWLCRRRIEKGHRLLTNVSLVLSVLAVLLLTLTRAPYAAAMAFLLLIGKVMLLFWRRGD